MIKNLQLCNIDCLHGTISVVNNFKDFQEVFKVFMSEPFFEAWTEEDMKEEFEDIKSHGEILGYYTNFDIAGLLTLIDGAKESHPVKFENPEKVIYISDVATKKEYRGKGYARILLDSMLEQARSLGYELFTFTTKPDVMKTAYELYKRMDFEELGCENGTVSMRIVL
jgi:ribosomal protein S18 acetylase RimI-like enzyme